MVTQLKKQKLSNDIAFVFGNGTSRLAIKMENFMSLGTVYGCNAQYREYSPHYLICVDVKMVNEVIASGYHRENEVWTNPNKGISTKNGINLFSPHKGWSSGPTALHFASTNGHREIYFFGFDFQGLNGKLNNAYADTFNYKKSTDSATFFGNWLSQTEKTIKEFRNTKFYRVIPKGAFIPDRLGPTLQNLKHVTYEELEDCFGSTIYSD
jgi:hypothetical protein